MAIDSGLNRRGVLGLSLAAVAQALLARPAFAQGPVRVAVGPTAPAWIDVAAADLAADLTRALGQALGRPAVAARAPAGTIRLLLVDESELARIDRPEVRRCAGAIRRQAEAFFWLALDEGDPTVLIVGSDAAGLRRGIYAFSRDVLKLDPTWRWTGLSLPASTPDWGRPLDRVVGSPRARHRGWFINDEDLLTEWMPGSGRRDVDYGYYQDVVSVEAIDRVMETAVRLGMNMISPASLLNVLNPPEARLLDLASRRGLKVTQHHIEPVGLSGLSWARHWRARGQTHLFSFYSERERMIALWRETIAGWTPHDTVWTLGLRGVADRPLWMADPAIPRDDATIGRLISDAIATQRAMVLEQAGGRRPEFTTLLWAEGAALLTGGHLEIPDDVTVVFADNSPGSRFQDDFRLPRDPDRRYGVYYHHQLWNSGPHLVQATPPDVTRPLLVDALAGGADDYVLMNVSNIREFVLGVSLSADIVTGRGEVQDESLEALCGRWFGRAHDLAVADLYRDFFAAYGRDPLSGRQIFLDGMLRTMGQTLIRRLDGTALAAPAGQAADTQAWAQRALSDMTAVDARLPEHRRILAAQCEAMIQVEARARRLASEIGGASGRLIQDNLAAQSAMIVGLGRWVLALADAADARDAGDGAAERASVTQAIAAIRAVEAAKAEAAHGEWRDWFKGDRKMNVPDLVEKSILLDG